MNFWWRKQALIWSLNAPDIRTHFLFPSYFQFIKKTFGPGHSTVSLPFGTWEVPFWKFGSLFIPLLQKFLFSFVSLDNVPSLTHRPACVWSCFLLMSSIFIKHLLCACNFDIISNQTMGTYWSARRFRKLSVLHMNREDIRLPWCA